MFYFILFVLFCSWYVYTNHYHCCVGTAPKQETKGGGGGGEAHPAAEEEEKKKQKRGYNLDIILTFREIIHDCFYV